MKNKTKQKADNEILNSFNSPNVWTPEMEDKWHRQVRRLSKKEIYERFPVMKKPPHISKVSN
jgi:hypothetical protein